MPPTSDGRKRWQLVAYIGNGKTRTRVIDTHPTTPEGLRQQAQLQEEANLLLIPAVRNIRTIGKLVTWHRNLKEQEQVWTTAHAKNQASLQNVHLDPYEIAEREYTDTTLYPGIFESHINNLPIAKPTRTKVRNLLHGAYDTAIHHGIYTRLNPLNTVRATGTPPKKRAIPESEQITQIQNHIEQADDRYMATAIAAAFCSPRRGELCALKWRLGPEDQPETTSIVDLDRLMLRIRRAVKGDGTTVGTPKSELSSRPIPLPTYIVERLVEWRETSTYLCQGVEPEWVFPRRLRGGGLDPTLPGRPDPMTRYFKRHVQPIVGETITLHSLRGWMISRLNAGGVNPADSASVAGHTRAVSIAHYDEATGADWERIVDILNGLL